MAKVLRHVFADILSGLAVAALLIGSANASELCEEFTKLIRRAESGFYLERGTDVLTSLSGAEDCGLSDNLDGTRNYHCMWEFEYRDPEAYDLFEKMTHSLRTCFGGSAAELRDQPVNHPDFYDQNSFTVEGVRVAVSIKDKGALQRTFAFVRIHLANAD